MPTIQDVEYEALRLSFEEAREREEDMLRRGIAVWKALAEAARVIVSVAPMSAERASAIRLLKEAGIAAAEAIVQYEEKWP